MSDSRSPDDRDTLVDADAPDRYRYVALALTVALAAGVLVIITAIAFAVAAVSSSGRLDPVLYLVSLFGVFVGAYGGVLAFYLLLAPRVDLPFTPDTQPPERYPLILLCVGLILIAANLRAFSGLDEVVFFWRVVAFALAAALLSGIAVFVVVEYTGFQGLRRIDR